MNCKASELIEAIDTYVNARGHLGVRNTVLAFIGKSDKAREASGPGDMGLSPGGTSNSLNDSKFNT